MSRSRKLWAGILLVAALIAVVVLASSISETTYILGANLGSESAEAILPQEPLPEKIENGLKLWQIYLVIGLFFVLAVTNLTLNRSNFLNRKYLSLVGSAILVLAIVVYISNHSDEPIEPPVAEPTAMLSNETEPTEPGKRIESPIFDQEDAPETGVAIISYLLIAGVVAVIGGGIALIAYFYFDQPQETPLDEIVSQAETAIAAIEAGGDLRDAILQCYVEMTHVVRSSRGLRRGEAMTPREFEQSLITAGLPAASVNRLTRLFEAVRYGGMEPGKRQELEALSALREIADAVDKEAVKRPDSAETKPIKTALS
ncbi:MAG: DUF4129 domain-containing protein [Anaerolineae bacterium]|nr:DUF4129 domain-containing protein [Anaerolineae bacterium]